jgi:hypothetical protein
VSAKGWRYALASVAGTSHARLGVPCQDCCDCRIERLTSGGSVLVAVAADGAGSAARAEVGAQLACALFLREMSTFYECGHCSADLSRDFFVDWLLHFQEEIRQRADSESLTPRDFATTLLGAVVENDRAAFVQVGDGAIVVSPGASSDRYSCVFWPRRGEYANTTYFATDADAPTHLTFDRCDAAIDEVALLTDGLQGLALEYRSCSAHAPFFQPVFAPVRAEPVGHSQKLSSALATFLGSPRVNARTDDDKTLVLASRRKRPARRAMPTDDRSGEAEE